MIIDGHTHIFTEKVISAGCAQQELTELLQLEATLAPERTSLERLKEEISEAGIDSCLLLPVAPLGDVTETNTFYLKMAEEEGIYTAGTLHPHREDCREELLRLHARGVRIVKLCSYSQRFSPAGKEMFELLQMVAELSRRVSQRFSVILDTFYLAYEYLGTPAECVLTPATLGRLVQTFPEIDFVAAHMGGLGAPLDLVNRYLPGSPNLFLDTSVAAHTLPERDFLTLLDVHGPEHIIFGTDWPWLSHGTEIALIDRLLDQATFTSEEKQKVFCSNMSRLLGLPDKGR